MYLATPFIMLRLLWRSLKLPAYRKRWTERFAFYGFPPLKQSLWIHAVSVGEFIAALPMIKVLLEQYASLPLVITTTTPTGSEQVVKHFSDRMVHVYLPYDLPGTIHRFLKQLNPKLAIIMETELWPNLLHQLKQKNIPTMLANARLSERSARGYQRIKRLTHMMLQGFSLVCAQSTTDGQRFIDLGLPKDRLIVTGNIKFDLVLPDDLMKQGQELRRSFGNRTVWTVASTHEGEEVMILRVFAKLKVQYPKLLLILVPRHPDRFNKVYHLCQTQSHQVARRSFNDKVHEKTDILLGDTIGEMKLFLATSDLAFVAGSLVPIGGHNLIEPAILGVPVLSGHHLDNFVAISKLLKQADALLISHNESQLLEHLIWVLEYPDKAKAMGERGRAVIIKNQGALKRHVQWVEKLLSDSDSQS